MAYETLEFSVLALGLGLLVSFLVLGGHVALWAGDSMVLVLC